MKNPTVIIREISNATEESENKRALLQNIEIYSTTYWFQNKY